MGIGIGAGLLGAPEAVENMLDLRGVEGAAGVTEKEVPSVGGCGAEDGDAAAIGGIADGVIEEVAENLGEFIGIRAGDDLGGGVPFDGNIFRVGAIGEGLPAFIYEVLDIHGLGSREELAAFSAGHGEEVVDEDSHLSGGGLAAGERGAGGGVIDRTAEGDIERGLQSGERGTEFVGDICGEGAFAVESFPKAAEESVDGIDDRMEFDRGIPEFDAMGEIADFKGGELRRKPIDDPHRAADEPCEHAGGDDNGERAEEGEGPTDAGERMAKGGFITGNNEREKVPGVFRDGGEGGGAFSTVLALFIGKMEGEDSGAAEIAVGEGDESGLKRFGGQIRGDGEGGSVKRSGADDVIMQVRKLIEVGSCLAGKFRHLGGIIVDVKLAVVGIDEGGEGGGFRTEGGIEFGVESGTDLKIDQEAEDTEDEGGTSGGSDDEFSAEAFHSGHSPSR